MPVNFIINNMCAIQNGRYGWMASTPFTQRFFTKLIAAICLYSLALLWPKVCVTAVAKRFDKRVTYMP